MSQVGTHKVPSFRDPGRENGFRFLDKRKGERPALWCARFNNRFSQAVVARQWPDRSELDQDNQTNHPISWCKALRLADETFYSLRNRTHNWSSRTTCWVRSRSRRVVAPSLVSPWGPRIPK